MAAKKAHETDIPVLSSGVDPWGSLRYGTSLWVLVAAAFNDHAKQIALLREDGQINTLWNVSFSFLISDSDPLY